jgi:hypothetical protein
MKFPAFFANCHFPFFSLSERFRWKRKTPCRQTRVEDLQRYCRQGEQKALFKTERKTFHILNNNFPAKKRHFQIHFQNVHFRSVLPSFSVTWCTKTFRMRPWAPNTKKPLTPKRSEHRKGRQKSRQKQPESEPRWQINSWRQRMDFVNKFWP